MDNRQSVIDLIVKDYGDTYEGEVIADMSDQALCALFKYLYFSTED